MAGTIALTSWKRIRDYAGKERGSILTIKCTCHTDASFSANLDANMMNKIGGLFVNRVVCMYDGTTPVTTDSDLEITDSIGVSLLGSNGTNFVDNNTVTETMMYNTFLTNDVLRMPVEDEAWTLALTNNSVNSAVFHLKFYMTIPAQLYN